MQKLRICKSLYLSAGLGIKGGGEGECQVRWGGGWGDSPKWWQIIIEPGNLATIFFICLIRPMKACEVNQFTGMLRMFRITWPTS